MACNFIDETRSSFIAACHEKSLTIPQHQDFANSAKQVWLASDFAHQISKLHPEVITDLFESRDIFLEYTAGHYRRKLQHQISESTTLEELGILLRRYRRREMLRILWRDVNEWTSTPKTLEDLSSFADACIATANEVIYQHLCHKYGTPTDPDSGEPLPLIVIAMGKLGAQALNFSSDVDLIYCYPMDGVLASGMNYQEFFIKQSRRLTQILHQSTRDGFVFRVDLRLRPYGNSGALACSINSIQDYYQEHGRHWERYALSKARIINDAHSYAEPLMLIFNQFVYRNYLDYTAINAMRQLHETIALEIKKQNLHHNIKRGAGGIREIEFICQTHQLIRGGKQFRLREKNTVNSLILLRQSGCMTSHLANKLKAAYLLLRKVENRLQMFRDQQTHSLPTNPLDLERIALSLGYEHSEQLHVELVKQQEFIHKQFNQLIATPELEFSSSKLQQRLKYFQQFWQCLDDSTSSIKSFQDKSMALSELQSLKHYIQRYQLSEEVREQLSLLIPKMLVLISERRDRDATLRRVIPIVKTIIEHETYIVLLYENPLVLSQAVDLCAASPWIAEQLSRHPMLLDELLDPNTLFSTPSKAKLNALLKQRLEVCEPSALESQLNIIREFKTAHVLRVAAAELTGTLKLMRVSDYLTEIALVVVNKVTNLILDNLSRKYHIDPKAVRQHFAVVAYGKLGGIELSYESDLDLVYLYNGKIDNFSDNISNAQLYLRACQQINQALEKYSAFGRLYPVDLRLRPSGSAGLLCNSLEAFANYQYEQAWCWEHQALSKAHLIYGSPASKYQFKTIRHKTLSKVWQPEKLIDEICSMRDKLRYSKQVKNKQQFDIKQAPGGTVDIEFIAQYAALRWGHDVHELLTYPDTIRILERAGMAGVLPVKETTLLIKAYKIYRQFIHRTALQKQPAIANSKQFTELSGQVAEIWGRIFEV